ncbi:hypothetical protein HYV88_04090 [Candidatus Woesearchaeota archaeon]|nr:hypothetical protein [Candidatus Woesearchaeota archaeon]
MKRGSFILVIIISLFALSGCVFLQQPIGPLNLEQAKQRIEDCSGEALVFIEVNDDAVSTIRPTLDGNFLVYGQITEENIGAANTIPSETSFSDGSYIVTIITDYGQRREYVLTPDKMNCNNFWSVSTRIPSLYNLYKIIGTGKYIIDINSPSHVLTIEGSLSQGCNVYKDGSTTADNIPTAFSDDGINWLLVNEEYPQNQNPLVGKVIVNTNSPSCVYTAKIKIPKKKADNLEFEEFELINPQEIEEVKN